MPKADKGVTGKSPGKQEEDAETRAVTSLAEAMERHRLADEKAGGACPTPPDAERHRGERFAIYVEVERHRGLDTVVVDKAVPTYTWTEPIIRDHLERHIPEMTQMIMLSTTAVIFFKGRRSVGEGYTGEEAHQIIDRVAGAWSWAGTDAMVAAYAVTLREVHQLLVKAREFVRCRTIQKMLALKSPPMPTEWERKPVIGEAREHRRKKVRRADVYWARKLESGHTQHAQRLIDERLEALTHPPLVDVPYSSGLDSDDGPYGLAQDAVSTPGDSSPYEVTDSEEEGDDVVAYDTEDSHQTTLADRNRLRKRQRQRRERRERQCWRERRGNGAMLPLFKNSSKEGATPYIDWRNCVNELVADKLDEARIQSLVMQSLEGLLKDTARLAFKKGKGTLKDILKVLDKLYGRSASYVHLQSEMCNIQQLYRESAQDYYEWLICLQVAIQDRYPERLHEMELERTAQEAFYNGLCNEYKPMVVHMLENPGVTVGDLVEAVRKVESIQERRHIQRQDASRYAPSTSYHKPAFEKDKGKDKDWRDDRGNPKSAVRAQVTQVEPDSELEFSSSAESDEEGSADENALWRDGYYCCAIRNVDQLETFFGACFNCRDQDHRWRQCTKPLRQALQEIKDQIGQDSDWLNVFGGSRNGGAGIPKKDQRGPRAKAADQPPKPAK